MLAGPLVSVPGWVCGCVGGRLRLRWAALTALQGPPASGQNSQGQRARRGQTLQLQDALVLLSAWQKKRNKHSGSLIWDLT